MVYKGGVWEYINGFNGEKNTPSYYMYLWDIVDTMIVILSPKMKKDTQEYFDYQHYSVEILFDSFNQIIVNIIFQDRMEIISKMLSFLFVVGRRDVCQ